MLTSFDIIHVMEKYRPYERKLRFRKLLPKRFQPQSEPIIKVRIFYSSHGTERDRSGIGRHMRGADIVIPEGTGWTQSTSQRANLLSQGALAPAQLRGSYSPDSDDAQHALWKRVYKSGKPVAYIDIPEGKKLDNKLDADDTTMLAIVSNILTSPRTPHSQSFEELVRISRAAIIRHGKHQSGREDYMIKQFLPTVKTVIAEKEELQKKDTVIVELILGSVHTRIGHVLKKKGYEVQRTFSYSPLIFDHFSEGLRRGIFNKSMDDTFIARVFLTEIIRTITEVPIDKDFDKLSQMLRIVASQYSYDEIKDMIEDYWRQGEPEKIKRYFTQALMSTKGVQLPRTEKELNVFLGIASGKRRKKRR